MLRSNCEFYEEQVHNECVTIFNDRWNNGTMTFCGRWLGGLKHGPGFLRVLSRNHTAGPDDVVPERVFFEVWSKGDRKFREEVNYTWNDLPPIDELELFHSWKWVWEDQNETNNTTNENLSESVATSHAAVPVTEDESVHFDPVADENEHDPLQSEVRSVIHRRESLDEVLPTRRHFSVDFYSSLSKENYQASEKPRSSSFSLHRCSRRLSSKKVHHIKGGYIVISAIRKKIKIPGLVLT